MTINLENVVHHTSCLTDAVQGDTLITTDKEQMWIDRWGKGPRSDNKSGMQILALTNWFTRRTTLRISRPLSTTKLSVYLIIPQLRASLLTSSGDRTAYATHSPIASTRSEFVKVANQRAACTRIGQQGNPISPDLQSVLF